LGYFFGFQQNGYDRIHSKIFLKGTRQKHWSILMVTMPLKLCKHRTGHTLIKKK